MRRQSHLAIVGCAIGLIAVSVAAVETRPSGGQSAGVPTVTLRVPEAIRLELALDEFVLDWSGADADGRDRARQPAVPAGADLTRSDGLMAEFALGGQVGSKTLKDVVSQAESANGAAGYVVLYEPGVPRSRLTRFLLTREVVLILASPDRLAGVLDEVGVETARAIPGMAGAYVILAPSPLEAQDLADACLLRPGVSSAYPSLRRPVQLR